MRPPALLCGALLALLGGCASAPPPPPPPKPLRFAALAAPLVSLDEDPPDYEGPEESEPLAREEVLLELATQLSTEVGLHFALVAGPLLVPQGKAEAAAQTERLESLCAGLGSLAGPVYLGLSPQDEAGGGLGPLGQRRPRPGARQGR